MYYAPDYRQGSPHAQICETLFALLLSTDNVVGSVNPCIDYAAMMRFAKIRKITAHDDYRPGIFSLLIEFGTLNVA